MPIAFIIISSVMFINLSPDAQTRDSYCEEWRVEMSGAPLAPTLYPDAQKPTGVVAAAGNEVMLFGGDGAQLWKASFDRPVATPATVADLDGDGTADVVVALGNGDVICLDGDGSQRWRQSFNAPPGGFNIIVAADVLDTPGLELLFGFQDGWLNCTDAGGELLWRFFGDKYWVGPPGVGDVDGDGRVEIVYGTDDGHIYCLTGAGEVEWRYAEPVGIFAPYGRSGTNLADLDGDRRVEVLLTRSNVGIDSGLLALDGSTGARKWLTRDVLHGYISNATVDLDGDGLLETLHADKGNWLYCVNADGTERWRTPLAGRGIFYAPAVGDINGDGALEIVVSVRDTDPDSGACTYVVGADGTVLERLQLGKSAKTSPAIADIDGDGELEVIVATEGPNCIRVLSWGGAGEVAWPSIRGDSAMTARVNVAPGAPETRPPVGRGPRLRAEKTEAFWGENALPFERDFADPLGAFATISVRPRKGYAQIRAVCLASNREAIPWNVSQPGKADLTLRVFEPGVTGATAAWRWGIRPQPPDSCGFVALSSACEDAISVGERMGADTRGLVARLTALDASRKAVARLASANADGRVIAERATQLRKQAKALSTLAKALGAFWEEGHAGSFVCWQDANPWDRFDPLETPDPIAANAPVKLTAYGNEHEDIALSLLNVSAKPIDVRCTFVKPHFEFGKPQPEPSLAKHITLRRAVRVPSQKSGMVNDALPALDRSRTIRLAPGEVSQLWLVVDTYGLGAGSHEATLYLGSLEETPTIREVPLTIEVLPVSLPVGVYAQMNWVGINTDETSDQQLRDMLDHGVTVAYGPTLPVLTLDENGDLCAEADWNKTNEALARLPDCFQLLFSSPPRLAWPEGMSVDEDSELYRKGFAGAVREMARRLDSQGFGYDRWAFYPVDEPWLTGGTLVPKLRRFCKMVREADPKVRNYTDPAGLVRAEYLEEFKDLIDIWQPEMNLLKRDPRLLEWFRENARSFWAYEATDPGKDLLPLGYYRGFAWLAWAFGLDGAGFWCYKYHDIYWPLETTHWSVVYQTNDAVVPSRRWEATRDGQEDYRAFHALREDIEKARSEGREVEARHAQALMDEAIQKVVAWQIKTIDEVTRQTREYELDYELLMEYRMRIAENIMRLRGLTP